MPSPKQKICQPSEKILENYANILVNFALNGGKGIKRGDTVILQVGEYAKPMYIALAKAIWKAGGNIISRYRPDTDPQDITTNLDKTFFDIASKEQLAYFPAKFLRGMIDDADHVISIISETDPHELEGVDAGKIMARGQAMKPVMDWRRDKEMAGKFSWTLALYATPAMAKEAGLSHTEFWNEIIKACFLDAADPIAEWKKVFKQIETYQKKLNKLPIDKLHVFGPDADLWITLGEKRQWLGGSGQNIPSFEIFTSPDWRGTNGWIRFNQPLFRYGTIIEGIELEFKNGRVIRSHAKKNYPVLDQMIKTAGADKIGEFSLTDRRFSRITKFMANTLFDENVGGPEGNTHLALGMSYRDTYSGDITKVKKDHWVKHGFNDSSVHTDIMSTAPRTVTAILKNGEEKLIYKDGQFTI